MIENHRTGLLWDLFMSAPEVRLGLTKLGFTAAEGGAAGLIGRQHSGGINAAQSTSRRR